MSDYIKKNGLLYSEDMRTVYGVDSSNEFTGRVPFGAHEFEDEAFSGCICETISLPDSTEKVGDCLFQNCENLKKVKLPANLTKLSKYMFSGCSALESVTMPLTVQDFPEGLFQGCSKLSDIPFRAGIKELPENVFEGCTSLKSVVIPGTVERISAHAFGNCTSLETVVLPDGLYALSPDAFEGCTSIHNVRISTTNKLLYISEKDGCLYERSVEGDDVLLIKINSFENQQVSFYKDDVDGETDTFFSNEDLDEDDDMFSSEIGAGEEELAAVGAAEQVNKSERNEEVNQEEGIKMEGSNIDDLCNDIMSAEKDSAVGIENVSVSEKELEVLGETMDVINDSSINRGASVSTEELENLFSAQEKQEEASNKAGLQKAENDNSLDKKSQILVDSAETSKVLYFTPTESALTDDELFIIAEKTVTDAAGEKQFSEKLLKCAQTFARIHDFKRVILLAGLPVDNEEFLMFYSNFISKRNLILACEAASPSLLSPYCKIICESSRISLAKDEMIEQRKKAGIKNDSLIKLVIQDKYM